MVLLLLSYGLFIGPAHSAPLYSILDLGVIAGHDASVAYGINNAGQVVGESYRAAAGGGTGHAFLWSGGTMTDLGTLGGRSSVATAINDTGMVVGYSDRADGSTGAFLFSGGAMIDLGTLGGPNSQAWGINSAGVIVGTSQRADSSFAAFRYESAMLDLQITGVARGINDSGQIVGYRTSSPRHAFLYDSGGIVTDLGTLGGPVSAAFAINRSGAIVGQSLTSDSSASDQGFVFVTGTMSGIPGSVAAWDINDAGNVVGSPAFLLSAGVATALSDLLASGSGWSLVTAGGINDFWQIVGSGNIGVFRHAFLMSPGVAVSEPTLLLLVSIGLFVLLSIRVARA